MAVLPGYRLKKKTLPPTVSTTLTLI